MEFLCISSFLLLYQYNFIKDTSILLKRQDSMSESQQQEKRNFFVPPVFHKTLQDLSSSQGECLVLECRVKGVPPPKITWQREGYVIDDCADFRMLHKGEVATLVIGEVFPEDTGIFTCEATNKAGTARTSCKITIKGGGQNSIATKAAAVSVQNFQQPRLTQVLPSTTQSSCTFMSSSSSSIDYHSTCENHISHLNFEPKNPLHNCKEKKNPFNSNSSSANTPLAIQRPLSPPLTETTSSSAKACSSVQLQNYHSRLTSSSGSSINSSSSSSSASRQVAMATAICDNELTHIPDENHNFKVEKDQVIQEVANTVSSPPQTKLGNQKRPSREMAIIERDIQHIQLRHSMAATATIPNQLPDAQEGQQQGDYILYSPTLAAILEIEPQEYKISTFEQRLMSEIEYRLERTPPVNEDPEDAIFENVPVDKQAPPTFTQRLKNFKAMDTTSATFSCHVSANPKAKVYWFKDGKQISKRSQHFIQKKNEDGGHELHIPHLCVEDDGNYTALAINPQGKVSATGRLAMISEYRGGGEVKSPTNSISKQSMASPHSLTTLMASSSATSNHVASSGAKSSKSPSFEECILPGKGELAADEESPVEKYYRPAFLQKPAAEVQGEEGKLIRFDVKVTGLPKPDIVWLINGRAVRQDAYHKILVRENNVHSLLIERASPMDEGLYTITASNIAGSSVSHVKLHVTPREHMTPPAFVQRLAGQCIAEGDSVRLEARVIAAPRPVITWKRGSDQIVADSRTQLYSDDSGYVCLQITKSYASDGGWYTCSAANKAGIASCNCKLDVYSPIANVPSNRRRIKTPHRYANLAKVAGVDMREALSPEAQAHQMLTESEEL